MVSTANSRKHRSPCVTAGMDQSEQAVFAHPTGAAGLPPAGRLLKRGVDIVLATFGLVILAPVFIIIAWAIRIDSSGPILYTQPRGGERGGTFRIYKFRTMNVDADDRLEEVL